MGLAQPVECVRGGALMPAITEPLSLGEAVLVALPVGFVQGRADFGLRTTVSLPGTVHGLGTADLLIQVYGTGSPAPQIFPGSITVHPSTYDITVTFRQPTAGYLVVSSRMPAAYGQSFTSVTSVTVPGASHGFGTATLLVEVYDAATPRGRIVPGSVTIDRSTSDVQVTF